MRDWGVTIGSAVAAVVFLLVVWYLYANTVTCEVMCSVNDHRFEPAHYNNWTSTDCVSRNKRGDCTMTIVTQHHDFVPDAWYLHFAPIDGGAREHWVTVSKETHDKTWSGSMEKHEHWRWKKCEVGS